MSAEAVVHSMQFARLRRMPRHLRPYRAAAVVILLCAVAGLWTWLSWLNLTKLPPIAGVWKIAYVSNAPPLLASQWPQGKEFFITRDGGMGELPISRNIGGVITRDLCLRDCYTLAIIESDYRLEPVTRYQVNVSHLPTRLELLGPAGLRVVALKVRDVALP